MLTKYTKPTCYSDNTSSAKYTYFFIYYFTKTPWTRCLSSNHVYVLTRCSVVKGHLLVVKRCLQKHSYNYMHYVC